jgi:hypothetical protein
MPELGVLQGEGDQSGDQFLGGLLGLSFLPLLSLFSLLSLPFFLQFAGFLDQVGGEIDTDMFPVACVVVIVVVVVAVVVLVSSLLIEPVPLSDLLSQLVGGQTVPVGLFEEEVLQGWGEGEDVSIVGP